MDLERLGRDEASNAGVTPGASGFVSDHEPLAPSGPVPDGALDALEAFASGWRPPSAEYRPFDIADIVCEGETVTDYTLHVVSGAGRRAYLVPHRAGDPRPDVHVRRRVPVVVDVHRSAGLAPRVQDVVLGHPVLERRRQDQRLVVLVCFSHNTIIVGNKHWCQVVFVIHCRLTMAYMVLIWESLYIYMLLDDAGLVPLFPRR